MSLVYHVEIYYLLIDLKNNIMKSESVIICMMFHKEKNYAANQFGLAASACRKSLRATARIEQGIASYPQFP